MVKISAGILVYRRIGAAPEFLLSHPRGPYWTRRDMGVWTVRKGLVEPNEDPISTALGDYQEETGMVPTSPLRPLKTIRQTESKICWAAEQSLPLTPFRSQDFQIEWPPRSDRFASFPELDRIGYFTAAEALQRILRSLSPLIHDVLGFLA